MLLSSGRKLGPYTILSPLGAGGMGEVYRAHDPRLARDVAIKILPESTSNDPNAQKRFEREMKALASVSHANILEIHDFGTDTGLSYAVMEVLEGHNLREEIGNRPLPVRRVVEIGVAVAEGLAAAHAKGVIHRDLKPENIFLASDGRIKILDFGLARWIEPASEDQREAPTKSLLSEEGSIRGTVPYMSPEQIRGGTVDARTDIFSFGCVLYEMISGRRAFAGPTAPDTMSAILKEEPNFTGLPEAFRGIIQHCLEKNPEQRFQSARDLVFALKQAITPPATIKTFTSEIKDNRLLRKAIAGAIAAIVLAAIFFVVGNYVSSRHSSISSTPKIQSLAVLPLQNLSGDPKQEYFADGMTEELIATLARLESVRVISRTSVMEYKNAKKPLPQIAKELNVDAVIEGSVLPAGNRIRVTAQLIDASNDRHLWAQSYERDLSDVLGLQSEVASRIADEINATLTARIDNSVSHVDPAAYQAYLRGVDAKWRSSNDEAIAMFQKAVDLDPHFTLAYARLSMAHSFFSLAMDPSAERLKKAKDAADRAFELEPNSPQAHLALGYYYYWGKREYESALEEFSKAAKLRPGDGVVWGAIAAVQRRQGKFQISLENFKKALQLRPREASAALDVGVNLQVLRKYAEAEYYYHRTISLAPDDEAYYGNAAMYYNAWKGDTSQSREILKQMPQTKDAAQWWLPQYLVERKYSEVLKLLRDLPDDFGRDVTEYLPKSLLSAFMFTYTNQPKEAHRSFEAAYQELTYQLNLRPDDHRIHAALGLVDAGLGKERQAVEEAKRVVEMYPVSKDALKGPDYLINLAHIYVINGQYDLAFDEIERVLSIPSFFSVGLLKLEPRWDPLRKLPRYKQIMEKYS